MRTILTILLTSLFWSFVIMVWFEPRSDQSQSEEMYAETTVVKPNTATTVAQQSGRKSAEKEVVRQVSKETPAPAAKQPTTPKPEPQISNKVTEVERKMVEKPSVENVATAELDYVGEIDGKWTPVEGAEFPLEFTKYGTLIQTRYGSLNVRHFYTISSDKRMKIGYNSARFEIVKSGGDTYLEIFGSSDYSGKYRRVWQPAKISMTRLDESLYPTKIVGKWSPINGQEYPLEITKYGTAIQTKYGSLDIRHDYELNGDVLTIGYDKCRVVLSEDASCYYLEIYNGDDFSGRYRKSK